LERGLQLSSDYLIQHNPLDMSRRSLLGVRNDLTELYFYWKSQSLQTIREDMDRSMMATNTLAQLIKQDDRYRLVLEPSTNGVAFWFIPRHLRKQLKDKAVIPPDLFAPVDQATRELHPLFASCQRALSLSLPSAPLSLPVRVKPSQAQTIFVNSFLALNSAPQDSASWAASHVPTVITEASLKAMNVRLPSFMVARPLFVAPNVNLSPEVDTTTISSVASCGECTTPSVNLNDSDEGSASDNNQVVALETLMSLPYAEELKRALDAMDEAAEKQEEAALLAL